MIHTRRLAYSIVLLWAGQVAGLSQSKPLELKWSELAGMVAGHSVELTLAGGGAVAGEALAVREDSILMDVRKTSAGEFQKGSAAIPKGSIGLIKLERGRGGWGRTLGTVLGVISGLTLGGWAAAHTHSAAAGIPTFLGIASGVSLTGYYAGRELDRRTTLIRVVP
jgi:hypothetical protein